jgi:hypothetical protein
MSSKAETARINGARSNGPVTAEGKAASAQNSLKHGLTSSRVVLPHESQDDYDKLAVSFTNRFKPADELETELVQEMAAARWRLRRIETMESALFKKAIRQQREALGVDADESDVQDAAYAEVADSKSYRMLVRHAAQLRRAYEKAWKELQLIQEHRKSEKNNEELQNEPGDGSLRRKIDAILAMPFPGSGYLSAGRADEVSIRSCDTGSPSDWSSSFSNPLTVNE